MTQREEISPKPIPGTMKENLKNQRMRELFEINKNMFIFEELKQYADYPNNLHVLSHKMSSKMGGNSYVIAITDGDDESPISRQIISMRAEELTPDILYLNNIDVDPRLRGGKIAPFFHQRLEGLAKNAGYKFIAGLELHEKLAKLYIQRGSYFIEEIKPEFQKEFEEIIKKADTEPKAAFTTIKFLDQQDIKRYVEPQYLNMSIDERLECNKKKTTMNRKKIEF